MSYTCKRDADGWQLYSSMEGAEDAARTLSNLLTNLVNDAKARLDDEPFLSERKLAKHVVSEIYDAMSRLSRFGAADTEPRNVMLSEVERAFGLDEYTLEV